MINKLTVVLRGEPGKDVVTGSGPDNIRTIVDKMNEIIDALNDLDAKCVPLAEPPTATAEAPAPEAEPVAEDTDLQVSQAPRSRRGGRNTQAEKED